MTSSTSHSSSTDEPLHIELEFVRAKEADDAFAFRFTRQTYLVRGRQGAYETAELPWNKELLRDLEEVRRPDRDPATVARVGALLREFLDPAGWGAHESTIVQARADRRRVHLTIRSAAAELYALPWELLTLRADGQHLGALDHLLLRYAWPGTTTISTSDDGDHDRGRRVLMAWSAAGGAVPAAEQTKAIEAAVADGGEVEIITNATYGQIADALEAAEKDERPFTALHLLCHGAEAGSTFGLSFDSDDGGRPVVVDAGRLQQLLSPHAHRLRLVVVSACDGGNMGEPGNRIGSVAQRLHRAGIQYVVASRYPLSARGSTRMTTALYQSLFDGDPVERAFVLARTAASREVSQLDWASVQLYARPEDGDHGAVLARPKAPAPVAVAPVEASSMPVPVTAVATTAPAGGSSKGLLVAVGLVLLAGVGVFGVLNLGKADDAGNNPPAEASRTAAAETKAPASTADPPHANESASESAEAGSGGPTPGTPSTPTDATASAGDGKAPTEPAGDTSASETTSATPTTPANTTTSTRPRPRPSVDKSKPKERCKAVTPYVKGLVEPSSGSSLELWVFKDGTSKVAKCDGCGAKTKSDAKGIRASKIKSNSKRSQELPCRAIVKW